MIIKKILLLAFTLLFTASVYSEEAKEKTENGIYNKAYLMVRGKGSSDKVNDAVNKIKSACSSSNKNGISFTEINGKKEADTSTAYSLLEVTVESTSKGRYAPIPGVRYEFTLVNCKCKVYNAANGKWKSANKASYTYVSDCSEGVRNGRGKSASLKSIFCDAVYQSFLPVKIKKMGKPNSDNMCLVKGQINNKLSLPVKKVVFSALGTSKGMRKYPAPWPSNTSITDVPADEKKNFELLVPPDHQFFNTEWKSGGSGRDLKAKKSAELDWKKPLICSVEF